ncbi:MAG TPA: transcriptional regulator FeaR [Terriglobales bacterium]|nr:transcriptional regulator FeaR [Terriglobales bacterium]
MSQLFSTELIPASDRLEAWQSHARLICGNSHFDFPRQVAFRGVIDCRSVGVLQLTQFSSTPVSFAKYPIVTAKSSDPGCLIISQLRGSREYCQNGRSIVLQPRDTTLVDAGRPWSSACGQQCSRLYLRLPRWLVQEKLGVSELPLLQRISGASGLGATLFRLGTSLYREAGELVLDDGVAAIEAYLHILAACVAHERPDPIVHDPSLYARINSYIQGSLADPNLSPSRIAAEAGISVRHLHRLFARHGLTVSEYTRQKRLENCRVQLSDAHFIDHSITDIAFSWGFSDSAHFSRCFKRQFGLSPREFRSRLLHGNSGSKETRMANGLLRRQPGCPN